MSKEIKTAFVPKTVNQISRPFIYGEYQTLLTAYTEQQAELEKAKQTISDLHVGVKEIREKLEATEQELEKAREVIVRLTERYQEVVGRLRQIKNGTEDLNRF